MPEVPAHQYLSINQHMFSVLEANWEPTDKKFSSVNHTERICFLHAHAGSTYGATDGRDGRDEENLTTSTPVTCWNEMQVQDADFGVYE